MGNLTISENPLLLVFLAFLVVWILIDAILRSIFPKKGSKSGKIVSRVFLTFLLFGGIYWYFSYQKMAAPLIKEGLRIGQTEGKGKDIDWCLQNSGHQFQEGLEHEARLKIEGFSLGCLQAANNSNNLCQELPESFSDVTSTSYFGSNCGPYEICEMVYDSAKEFCASNI